MEDRLLVAVHKPGQRTLGDVTAAAGAETEVFIHGALCYSYSGLCLFSAQTLGRSGNRGKCAYSCRDSFEVTGAPDALRDGSSVKRDPPGP
jgi:putative protease